MFAKRAHDSSQGASGRRWGNLLAPAFAGLFGVAACAPPPSTSPDGGAPSSSVDAGAAESSDADAPHPSQDAGARDAALDAGAPDSALDAGEPDSSFDAGGPHPSHDAGAEPADAGSDGGSEAPKDPTIPAINGACPVFKTGTVSVGGLGGIALVVGPKASGPTAPLVFYWHGTGGNSNDYTFQASSLANEVTSEGGILVSFQGSTGTGGDCSGTGIFSMDDFKIADQIVACAIRDHNIDPHRIYSTGCSAGGLQTGCMATERSSYLAAAAPNSGGILVPQTFDEPSHVPALMTMHGGTQDWVIVYFSMTSDNLDTQFKNAGGFVIDCEHGGGHCAAPAALYRSVWEFFKAHPFGVAPEPYESGIPSSFPSYCRVF